MGSDVGLALDDVAARPVRGNRAGDDTHVEHARIGREAVDDVIRGFPLTLTAACVSLGPVGVTLTAAPVALEPADVVLEPADVVFEAVDVDALPVDVTP
ncbi:MAG TPA: hypothetical protein VMY76_03980 [Gemmatimonadales bacterium]|nr:hypothetical protein [Gemmatimonadales bacterium]